MPGVAAAASALVTRAAAAGAASRVTPIAAGATMRRAIAARWVLMTVMAAS